MMSRIIATFAYIGIFGLICWQYSASDTETRSIMFYFLAFVAFGQMARYEFKLAQQIKSKGTEDSTEQR
ncbi:hypothetical protein [Photobacterium profundum]|uniref:hypothetical protein n=1 Tax=Photobacterium profundum TaxID=74109 RepID=UPI0003181F5A|nr:hypothetical protein [Photobacterium profundum]